MQLKLGTEVPNGALWIKCLVFRIIQCLYIPTDYIAPLCPVQMNHMYIEHILDANKICAN